MRGFARWATSRVERPGEIDGACRTPVAADAMPEIGDRFGSAVRIYPDPDDLARRVATCLELGSVGRLGLDGPRRAVLVAHTFDHRAFERLGALDGAGPVEVRDR